MGDAASEGDAVPGLGLPIVTAAEPACAGTPEQGLPMGVYSPMSPAWALPSQASLPSYGKPAMGASDASAATWSRRALGRPASAGNYISVRFATRFSGGGTVAELVTFRLEDNGTWRVAGYAIQ